MASPISDNPHPSTWQVLAQRPLSLSPPVSAVAINNSSSTSPSPSQPSAPPSSNARRFSIPFGFTAFSQPNTSSTSLIPSTAEGRPIPLDDSTTADRTTALRELNRSQPSVRHRYTKSTGAPSTATRTTTGTYSQPVIVRTYPGPPPSASSRPSSRRIPLSTVSITSNASNRRLGRNGMPLIMARQKPNRKPMAGDFDKLPPVEAFSFKHMMADIQQEHDIGADLDRIAEICARSRYSLSNQYEVHVAPHGSGTGFLSSISGSSMRQHVPGGPTLQAITSDDEHSSTRRKKRRTAGRRRSAAYGTLETIMSSSRSSDEDKSKKRSAQEIADEVRTNAARNRAESGSSQNSKDNLIVDHGAHQKLERKKSTSFASAVIESTRQHVQGDTASPRSSGTNLVSGPAKPKTSRSHLEIRTNDPPGENYAHEAPAEPSRPVLSESIAAAAIMTPDEPKSQSGLLAGFSQWMPWRGATVTEIATTNQKGGRPKSYAEGSLRELLKSTEGSAADAKGKGVDNGL